MKTSLLACALLAIAGASCLGANNAMKPIRVYIHTDLEGVTGIETCESIQTDGPGYQKCRELLMGDLNAAIEGAFEGGADVVTVLDSHGGSRARNFIPEMLDKRAEQDFKENKKWWGKLDESYCATMFIGAHAMAGTLNAFLDHTQTSVTWYNYSVNGRRFGELAQWATVAGHFGVPLVMMSGDAAACTEAKSFFSPVETAVVKSGIGRNKARLVESEEARRRIREAARKSMALIGKAKPFKPEMPMEIVLEFQRSDYCDAVADRPGVERIDARTIRKVGQTGLDIFP